MGGRGLEAGGGGGVGGGGWGAGVQSYSGVYKGGAVRALRHEKVYALCGQRDPASCLGYVSLALTGVWILH